jgi:hypothetical protein
VNAPVVTSGTVGLVYTAQQMNSVIGELLGQVYCARHFTDDAKMRCAAMVQRLIQSLGKTLGSLEWMSAPTKAKAQEKLNNIAVKIGYAFLFTGPFPTVTQYFGAAFFKGSPTSGSITPNSNLTLLLVTLEMYSKPKRSSTNAR